MSKSGRNKPCPCGSGKKYKKCCLSKIEDEQRLAQEEKLYEREVSLGRIDPFAGEEEWEEGSIEELEEDYTEEYGEEDDEYQVEDSGSMPENVPLSAEDNPKFEAADDDELSPEDRVLCDEWGAEYVTISDPDKLRTHIENFIDLHPDLIREIDLCGEPLLELGGMYVRQGRHQSHIDMLNRIRIEFPDEYFKRFHYFDNDAISWAIINGKKDTIGELLENYRQFPDKNADTLFELIDFLMSWNCQDILTDFLQDIYSEVCTSSKIFNGKVIMTPVITTVMAPYLEQKIDKMDIEELADKIKGYGAFVSQYLTDPKLLERQIGKILGKHEQWNLDDCRTRNNAIDRYHDMSANFMGWIVSNTGLDWCAAEHHRGLVFEYLATALPKKKKYREIFPFAEKDMERHIIKLSQSIMWLEPTRLFGFLNGIYLFQEFLLESLSLSPEQAKINMESCVRLFEKAYPTIVKQEFKALAWEKFPREDMKLV